MFGWVAALLIVAGLRAAAPETARARHADAARFDRGRRSGRPSVQPCKAPAVAGAPMLRSRRRPMLDRYCVTCHNDRMKTGGLTLQGVTISRRRASMREALEKAVRKLRAGAMPPLGAPRPDAAAMDRLRHVDRNGARSRRRGSSESRANRDLSSVEPDRVRQRHPRSARARHRCRLPGSRRRVELRLRQHRRRPEDLTGVHGALRDARPRRSAAWPSGR